jgi:hypothetical protein
LDETLKKERMMLVLEEEKRSESRLIHQKNVRDYEKVAAQHEAQVMVLKAELDKFELENTILKKNVETYKNALLKKNDYELLAEHAQEENRGLKKVIENQKRTISQLEELVRSLETKLIEVEARDVEGDERKNLEEEITEGISYQCASLLELPSDFLCENYDQELKRMIEDQLNPVNILVIGDERHGKNSFVKSCLTALSPKSVRQVKGIKGVQVFFGKYSLIKYAMPKVAVTFWVLEKRFPVEKDLWKILDGYETRKRTNTRKSTIGETDEEVLPKMDALIFVMDSEKVEDSFDDPEFKQVFKFLKEDKKDAVAIALNKIDLLGVRDFKKVLENKQVHQTIQKVSEETQVKPSMIVPMKCYGTERFRDSFMDRWILHCLSITIDVASFV